MATRAQVIELVIRQLAGGDPQWSFRWGDEREVGMHVDMVRDRMAWADIMSRYDQEGVNDNFISTFEDVPVLQDPHRNQYYFEMPARMLTLPKNMAIRQISRMKGQQAAFWILPATSSSFLTGLRGTLDGNIGIKIEGNKGWIHNLQGGLDCGLLIMMVVKGADVPEGQNYCAPYLEEAIKEQAIKELTFGLGVKEDRANDKIS
jgi:hypothetical protein